MAGISIIDIWNVLFYIQKNVSEYLGAISFSLS